MTPLSLSSKVSPQITPVEPLSVLKMIHPFTVCHSQTRGLNRGKMNSRTPCCRSPYSSTTSSPPICCLRVPEGRSTPCVLPRTNERQDTQFRIGGDPGICMLSNAICDRSKNNDYRNLSSQQEYPIQYALGSMSPALGFGTDTMGRYRDRNA